MGKPEVHLPPPPPVLPPNVVPQKVVATGNRVPMARPGVGTRGQSIQLSANHFKVTVAKTDAFFYQHSVSIKYEDGSPVDAKGIGKRILDKVNETYAVELEGKFFAYDGEKSLFTVGPLPQNKMDFTVILDEVSSNRNPGNGSPRADDSPDGGSDRKRIRRQPRSKTYIVAISYAAKIPMQAIANALRGQDSEHFQEAVRVLDIILRQSAAQQGCLLVRQSFFHNDDRNFVDLGGGVFGCRGFSSSFRATQGGLSLNMDVSTTMIVRPGPVIDFLLHNQKVDHSGQIDWIKAKKTLKNLRVKACNSNREYEISALSDLKCKDHTFSFKQRSGGSEASEEEITVYDYFVCHRKIQLKYSEDLPCLNVGKLKRPTYIPVELCFLVPLQRYTKALSNIQRAALVEKSRAKPPERMTSLQNGLSKSNYAADPLLKSSGVTISTEFTRVQGHVLVAPKPRVGNGEDFAPRNGRWNFNQKRLVEPVTIKQCAVVNFSARCDLQALCRVLIRRGKMKGMTIADPYDVIEEKHQSRRSPAPIRVDEMIGMVKSRLPGAPQFLLCQVLDKYLTYVLLKINDKLGDGKSELQLPPPPPVVPPNIVPQKVVATGNRVSMARPEVGSRGQSIQLYLNHFKVTVAKTDSFFYHYSVSIKYEDGSPVDAKGIGRRILDKVHETHAVELEGKIFAYDGEKSLYTVGPLPQNKLDFTVILDEVSSKRNPGNGSPGADGSPDSTDRKRMRRQPRSKTYIVAISYAAKIPMQAIANALRGQDSEHFQEAVRVLDIILSQQGCLLVRQSFFHNDDRSFVDLGGGVLGCRGSHFSFRATQGGLSLNMDYCFVRPGPVIDFLLHNQKVDHPGQIDWIKTIKNLRVKASNSNREYYAADPLLKSSGVTISTEFTRVQGRVLLEPKNGQTWEVSDAGTMKSIGDKLLDPPEEATFRYVDRHGNFLAGMPPLYMSTGEYEQIRATQQQHLNSLTPLRRILVLQGGPRPLPVTYVLPGDMILALHYVKVEGVYGCYMHGLFRTPQGYPQDVKEKDPVPRNYAHNDYLLEDLKNMMPKTDTDRRDRGNDWYWNDRWNGHGRRLGFRTVDDYFKTLDYFYRLLEPVLKRFVSGMSERIGPLLQLLENEIGVAPGIHTVDGEHPPQNDTQLPARVQQFKFLVSRRLCLRPLAEGGDKCRGTDGVNRNIRGWVRFQ